MFYWIFETALLSPWKMKRWNLEKAVQNKPLEELQTFVRSSVPGSKISLARLKLGSLTSLLICVMQVKQLHQKLLPKLSAFRGFWEVHGLNFNLCATNSTNLPAFVWLGCEMDRNACRTHDSKWRWEKARYQVSLLPRLLTLSKLSNSIDLWAYEALKSWTKSSLRSAMRSWKRGIADDDSSAPLEAKTFFLWLQGTLE